MSLYYLAGALAATSLASAAKVCTNVTVPVNIEARQGVFNVPTLQSNIDATLFSLNFTTVGTNFSELSLIGYQTVRGAYNISAKYCRPENDTTKNPTVQVLSHGVGFDKSYWDLPYNNYNYSYENVASDYGYHTVAIDRFGIGNSSHADPLNIVQAPAEVSALYEVSAMLREGTFPQVSTKFSKIVHVGHSFGSAQTYLLSAMYPNATDGIILTGFSMNGTWVAQTLADWNLHLARLNQPLRFGNQTINQSKFSSMWFSRFYGASAVQLIQKGLTYVGIDLTDYEVWEDIATTELGDLINGWNSTTAAPQNLPTGYLTWSDFTSNIFAFLNPGHFDIGFGLFGEMTKQPVTLGEIFTLANGAPNMTSFSGPVQIVTGNNDAIYCGRNCSAGVDGVSIPGAAKVAFPKASAFEAYLQPNTGHGINFHYNSTGAYTVIQNFLNTHGLASS